MNELNETESVANVLLDEDGFDEQITESSESKGPSKEELFDEESTAFADSGKDSGRFATKTEGETSAEAAPAGDEPPPAAPHPSAFYEKHGAPTPEQLQEYGAWIQNQGAQLDQARSNNQIDDAQYRLGIGALNNHAANWERGGIAQQKAQMQYQQYVAAVQAEITEFEPEFAIPSKRKAIIEKTVNFLKDDVGMSKEAISQLQHPETFKLVQFAMKAKQAKASKDLRAMKAKRAKAAKAKSVRDAPTREYNGALSHSEKADQIAKLLQDVGAV